MLGVQQIVYWVGLDWRGGWCARSLVRGSRVADGFEWWCKVTYVEMAFAKGGVCWGRFLRDGVLSVRADH